MRRTALTTSSFLVLLLILPLAIEPARSDVVDPGDGEPSLPVFDDVELFDLAVPEVVIAAGRREQLVAELPYAISVITAEDIRRAGALTVPDALRLIPGSNVAQLSANMPAVSLRGMHSVLARELLVLVDGRQIFDGFFGGTVWGAWPFQIEEIERIEVIRGPAGLTWGPNAVNGVINIITKPPAEQPTLVLRAGAGTRGWNRDYLGYSFSDERLSFRISGEFERSDGHVRGGTVISPLDDDYLTAKLNLKATLKLSEQDELHFAGGSSIVDGGYPSAPAYGSSMQGRSQANYFQLDWKRQVARDNHITVMTYVNDFHQVTGFSAGNYRYQQAALQLTHTFKPAETHTITWGIDTRLDYFSAGGKPLMVSRPFVTSGIVGLYLQDEWQFAEAWTLNAGARLDYHTHAGFEPSARVGVTRRLHADHLVFGAVSRAVHMPAAPFNYADLPLFGGLTRWHAKGILDNEPVMSYEVGYRGQFLDNRLDLSTSLFWSEIREIATARPALFDPGLLTHQLRTDGGLSIYGGEVEIEYRPAEAWRLLGHYTYQQFDWKSALPAPLERDILTAPRHQFMVGVQHDLTDDVRLSAHWYFVDEIDSPSPHLVFATTNVPSYHRLDLTAEYEFWEDRAAITVGVKNLLDNHHPEGGTIVLNDTEVPRMVFAELRLSLP